MSDPAEADVPQQEGLRQRSSAAEAESASPQQLPASGSGEPADITDPAPDLAPDGTEWPVYNAMKEKVGGAVDKCEEGGGRGGGVYKCDEGEFFVRPFLLLRRRW